MTGKGAVISEKIRLEHFGENCRGIKAVTDIKKDDELLFVPECLILRYDHIKGTKLGQ